MFVIVNKDSTAVIGMFDTKRSAQLWLAKRQYINGTIAYVWLEQEFDFHFPPEKGGKHRTAAAPSTSTVKE